MEIEVGPQHTFLFVDLAGYTALTEAHGDERGADLAHDFFKRTRALLAEHQAEEIKALGDALMLRADNAASAVRLAGRIVGDLGAGEGRPRIRAGLHTGPAVERDRDWFGTTVNIAARVGAVASEGEVVVTQATRDAAGVELPGLAFRVRGPKRLRHIREPVVLYAAVLSDSENTTQLPLDPVCRIGVDPERAAQQATYLSDEYFFCSTDCARAFHSDPGHYTRSRRRLARRDLRVSNNARDELVERLKTAHLRGRLTDEELDGRVELALQAQTRGDLAAISSDLPRRRRQPLPWYLVPLLPFILPVRRIRRRRQRRHRRRGSASS